MVNENLIASQKGDLFRLRCNGKQGGNDHRNVRIENCPQIEQEGFLADSAQYRHGIIPQMLLQLGGRNAAQGDRQQFRGKLQQGQRPAAGLGKAVDQ